MKTCTKCKESKDLSCFSKRQNGLRSTCKACDKADYDSKKDKYKLLNAKNYAENKERKLKNSEKCRRRYAAKLNASPAWANKEKVLEIYEQAALMTKQTGIQHDVDHIVPIVSNLVCGLHCESNLQVLKSTENYAKGNRYWPDMP